MIFLLITGKVDYSNQLLVISDEWELDPRLLKFSSPIGQGAFGKVVTGYYENQRVAIKLIRGKFDMVLIHISLIILKFSGWAKFALLFFKQLFWITWESRCPNLETRQGRPDNFEINDTDYTSLMISSKIVNCGMNL